MAEPDREAYEAGRAAGARGAARAEEAARAAAATSPPQRLGAPGAAAAAAPDLDALFALLEALRGTVPPELARQLADALRELLIAMRAVLDYYDRAAGPAGRARARRGGHPDPMSAARGTVPACRRSCSSPPRRRSRWCSRWSCPGTRSRTVQSTARSSRATSPRSASFTFVEAAILLVAARRAVPRLGALAEEGLPPAGRRRRRDHARRRAGRCCCSSGGCSTSPTSRAPGATIGIQWGIFGALLAAGALIAAGARVRAVHAPEPPNPAADDVGWVARAARASASARRTAARATRPRSPRCCATARRGRAISATRQPRASTTRRRRACPRTRPRRRRAASAARSPPSGLWEDEPPGR